MISYPKFNIRNISNITSHLLLQFTGNDADDNDDGVTMTTKDDNDDEITDDEQSEQVLDIPGSRFNTRKRKPSPSTIQT